MKTKILILIQIASLITFQFIAQSPYPHAAINQSVLDIEFRNQKPSFDLNNQYWTTSICGRSTWLTGDSRNEWTSILEKNATNSSEIVGVSGTVLNQHQSDNDVWFTHPFGRDWDLNIAWKSNPNFDFLQGPRVKPDAEADGIRLSALQKGFQRSLHVELDSAFIPDSYRAKEGNSVAIFGRWIVDCGHDIYQTEIHPPLIFVKAVPQVAVGGGSFTQSSVIGRPYMISQDFDDGKSLRDHLVHQIEVIVGKSLIPPFPGAALANEKLQAKPNILSKPFTGTHWMIFYVRPPRVGLPNENLYVSYHFTVRTGVTVTLFNVNDGKGTIGVNVLMDELSYISPNLPTKRQITVPLNVLEQNDDVKSLVRNLKGGVSGFGLEAVNYVLDKGILTDSYQLPDFIEPNDVTLSATQINAGKSVGLPNNEQPFPIRGSIKVEWMPSPKVIVPDKANVPPKVIVPDKANFQTIHPTDPTPGNQDFWRWCSKCQILFYGSNWNGICAADGRQHLVGTRNYRPLHGTGSGQTDWRWCAKCDGMFFDGEPSNKGVCKAGGSHDGSKSWDYHINHDDGTPGQDKWMFCNKCFGLQYSGNAGVCPAGGDHNRKIDGHSYNYILPFRD